MNCARPALLLALSLLTACAAPSGKKRTSASTAARPAATTPTARTPAPPVRAPAPATASTKPAPATAAKPAIAAAKPEPPRESARERFERAVKLVGASQFKEAEPLLEALIKENPSLSGPLTNLGVVYYKTGRREAALSAFSRAAVANNRNEVAWNWLGILYRESGDFGRAEQAYQRALQANDSFAEAHLNLGILYDQHLKKPAQAIEHYRRYGRLERGEELRVAAWIAALEPKKPEPKP